MNKDQDPIPKQQPAEKTKQQFTAACNDVIRNYHRQQIEPTLAEADLERRANAWYWNLD